MTPDVQLIADGEDVTAVIADRLVTLSVTDEEGVQSDRLSIEIDDRDRRIAVPPPETRLELSLGFRETGLVRLGSFVVDRRGGDGPPDVMRIEAKAADMATQIRAPKTRSWIDVTLGDIAGAIAGEAGLRPVVGADIAGTAYAMVAQTAESDLHLLTRLAAVLDATAKPADGRLVIVKRGSGQAADGTGLEPLELMRHRFTRYSWDLGERGRYRSVVAEWSDPATATLHKVVVGAGDPSRRLRHPFGSEDEARRAAQAALDRAERGNTSVGGELAGFEPGLFAGGLVAFADLRPELGGRFQVTRVVHRLAGALTTTFDSEIAEPAP